MNLHRIRTIFDLVEYFGLRVEFRDDLPDSNAGFLDERDEPEYIAVNRNLPHCEQVFTVAHELCHYISDHKKPRRKYRNRLLNQQYESRRARSFVRFLRLVVNKILPIEREADMFAMSWMVQYGGLKLLMEFMDRHPGKKWLCAFIMVNALLRLPFRLIKAFSIKLLLPRTEA